MNKKIALYLLSMLLVITFVVSYGITADFTYGPNDIKVPKWVPSKTISIGTAATSGSFTIEAYCLSDVVTVITPSITANTCKLQFLGTNGIAYYQSGTGTIPEKQADSIVFEKSIMISGPTTVRLTLTNAPSATANYTIKMGLKGN